MKKKPIDSTPALRELAESIAGALFKNGTGTRAERLILWRQAAVSVDQRAQDLGRWSEVVIADRIEDALRAAHLVPAGSFTKEIDRMVRTVEVLEKLLIMGGQAKRDEAGQLVPVEPLVRLGRHPVKR